MEANSVTETTRGRLAEPSLVLHSLVGAVALAAARTRAGLPLRERDVRALASATAGLGRQLSEHDYIRSAGTHGTEPDPSQRIDLAGLLLQVREARPDLDQDQREFAAAVQAELDQLGATVGEDASSGTQDLADRVGRLFRAATDAVAALSAARSERVLSRLG